MVLHVHQQSASFLSLEQVWILFSYWAPQSRWCSVEDYPEIRPSQEDHVCGIFGL